MTESRSISQYRRPTASNRCSSSSCPWEALKSRSAVVIGTSTRSQRGGKGLGCLRVGSLIVRPAPALIGPAKCTVSEVHPAPSRLQVKDTPELVGGRGKRGCVCGAEADDQARLGRSRAVVGAQAGGGDAVLGCLGTYLVFGPAVAQQCGDV